jgi:predicted lipoprotein with Yx(FWY)xxD motif
VRQTSKVRTWPVQQLTALAIAGALALGATAAVAIATQAQDGDPLDISSATDDLGTYLIDGNGNTLYFFVPDPPGASACEGDCLAAWPALAVGDDQFPFADDTVTGELSFAARDDGTRQATYRGRPLYYFVGDQAPGDTNGEGVSDVWWVAAEDGSLKNAAMPDAPELTLAASTTDLGTFITGVDGRTAYYFTVDSSPGMSLCEDGCLDAWPPVTLAEGAAVAAGDGVPGVLGIISATNGSPQVTYDGRPLYYFAGDQAAGDTNGQGVNAVWFVAMTDGQIHTE